MTMSKASKTSKTSSAHYIPPSIRDESLPLYLNRTAEQHNGLGYLLFRKLRDSGQNAAAMARAFKVNRLTMYKWWQIDNEEQQTALE